MSVIELSFGQTIDKRLVDAEVVDAAPLVAVADAQDDDLYREGLADCALVTGPRAVGQRPAVTLAQAGPLLAAQSLPIQNQYVLRMQAAFVLLDWIADRPRPNGIWPGHVWRTASIPSNPSFDDRKWRKHLQDQVALLVRGDQEALDSFRAHLKFALPLDEETVERLLWEPPRSILMEVAPILLRRIFRDWQLAWPSEKRNQRQVRLSSSTP